MPVKRSWSATRAQIGGALATAITWTRAVAAITRAVVIALIATVAVIAGSATAAPAATATPAATSAATPDASSGRPALGWPSGVYIPGDKPAAVASFGTWRGAQADVVVTWAGRKTWREVTRPTWLYDRWKATSRTVVLGLPPFPEKAGTSLKACAAGAYNGWWRQFGTKIRDAGMSGRTIIRLGWEFNGNWYAWSAKNPAAFAACWRHVQRSAESQAPALRWDWNVNRGASPLGIDPRAAYPGDRFVDIVGVDSYDGWPAVRTRADWNQHYNGAFGLKFWADFARSHGKKLSIPEWGVYPGTAWAGHNGGDNPFYVKQMFGFFRQQAANLAYEAYFNEPAPYYAGALGLNPRAAAEYRRQVRVTLAGRTGPSKPTSPRG